MIDYEEDAAPAAPTNKQLAELSELVAMQLNLEQTVVELQERLKDSQKRLDGIRKGAIPDKMKELGYSLLRMKDGSEVKVVDGIAASITKANQPRAYAWLKETGNESIIKHEIKLVFTGRQDEEFHDAVALLEGSDLVFGVNDSVHPQTLKAFVREELEAGREVDPSITVFEYSEAKISRA